MKKKLHARQLSLKSQHDWSDVKRTLLEDAWAQEHINEILFVTKYPTVSEEDNQVSALIRQLNRQFSRSFKTVVCALQHHRKKYNKSEAVHFALDPSRQEEYDDVIKKINHSDSIKLAAVVYDSTSFSSSTDYLHLISKINRPVIGIVSTLDVDEEIFHVSKLQQISKQCERLIVRTPYEAEQLVNRYQINPEKISILSDSASAYAQLFKEILGDDLEVSYNLPDVKTDLLTNEKNLDTKVTHFESLDEQLKFYAEALMATCLYYEESYDIKNISVLHHYLRFIENSFLIREDIFNNQLEHGDAAIGRVTSCLGYVYTKKTILPDDFIERIETVLLRARKYADRLRSSFSIALAIKGIFYYFQETQSPALLSTIERLAEKLASQYKKEASFSWSWFSSTLNCCDCVLAEAMLLAYLATHIPLYKKIAINAFDFFSLKIFNEEGKPFISSCGNFSKLDSAGEGDISANEVSDIIVTLSLFYDVFKDETYLNQMEMAFGWYLGNNHLYTAVYHEDQGICNSTLTAKPQSDTDTCIEPTIAYMIARLTLERYFKKVSQYKLSLKERASLRQVRKAITKERMISYLVQFSVAIVVFVIMIKKLFASPKPLEPSLFKN